MTDKTSHVFHSVDEHSNPVLARVFITPNTIAVSERVLRETITPGVMTEVVLHRLYYELKTNTHGDKYLKITRKFDTITEDDVSLPTLKRKELVWSNYYIVLDNWSELENVINETICEWFDYPKDTELGTIKAGLLFPALRNLESMNAKYKAMFNPQDLSALNLALGRKSRVAQALRGNSDWASFVKDLCSEEAIVNEEDVDDILSLPDLGLFHLATMRLGMSISEANQLGTATSDFLSTFTSEGDRRCIRFMLEYLPDSQRLFSTELVFDIATRFIKLKQSGYTISTERASADLMSIWRSRWVLPVQRIPTNLRPALAQALLERLSEGVEPSITQVEEEKDQRPDGVHSIELNLFETFTHWFAEYVVEPSLQTQLTQYDVEKRCGELFGPDFSDLSQYILFDNSKTGMFWHHNPANMGADMALLLQSALRRSAAYHEIHLGYDCYMSSEGKLITQKEAIYSLDYLMDLIEISAKETDKALIKLGRAVTTENRVAYLTFHPSERGVKSSWHYYDLGVTESRKIVALKMCKIANEDDIRTYAALPDELFYELIGLLNERAVERSEYLRSQEYYRTEATRYLEEVELE